MTQSSEPKQPLRCWPCLPGGSNGSFHCHIRLVCTRPGSVLLCKTEEQHICHADGDAEDLGEPPNKLDEDGGHEDAKHCN